jgi:hypothetical protein
VPSDPPQAARSAVEVFCESNVLDEMRDELRLECSRRGNSITVVEGRPPWNPELIGTEWTSMNVAQLRYTFCEELDDLLLRSQRARVALRQHRAERERRRPARRNRRGPDWHRSGAEGHSRGSEDRVATDPPPDDEGFDRTDLLPVFEDRAAMGTDGEVPPSVPRAVAARASLDTTAARLCGERRERPKPSRPLRTKRSRDGSR